MLNSFHHVVVDSLAGFDALLLGDDELEVHRRVVHAGVVLPSAARVQGA